MQWRLLLSSCERAGSYAYARAVRTNCSLLVGLSDKLCQKFPSSVFDEIYNLSVPANSWFSGGETQLTDLELEWIDKVIALCRLGKLEAFVPLGDPELLIVAKGQLLFQEAGILVLSAPNGVVEKILDKGHVMTIAEKHSAPHPITLYAEGLDPDIITQELSLPLVVKAQFSSGSEWVWLVNTKDQLLIKLRRLELLGRTAVVQEYIWGGVERSLHVLLDRENTEVLAFVLRKPHHIRPSLSTSIELLPVTQEFDAFRGMAKALQGPALYIFQLKQDANSLTYKLIEVSTRPGTNWRILVPLLQRQGINLPVLSLRAALGETLQPVSMSFGELACAPFDQLGSLSSYIRAKLSRAPTFDPANSMPSIVTFARSWLKALMNPSDIYISALRDDLPMAVFHYKSLARLTAKTFNSPPTIIPWGDV